LGLVGTYDKFPNGQVRTKPGYLVQRQLSRFSLARFLARLLLEVRDLRLVITALRRKRLIAKAKRNGYQLGQYVQGGGWAFSSSLVRALASNALLDDPFLFFHSRLGDDVAVTIMCHAVGLQVFDFNGPGEVFAVVNNGIPDSPEALWRSGYAVVHSVKSDERWSEFEIRKVFSEFREQVTAR
jgi:hypothetical protein